MGASKKELAKVGAVAQQIADGVALAELKKERKWLDKQGDVDWLPPDERSLLYAAVEAGSFEWARELIDLGAAVNRRSLSTRYELTFFEAAERGLLEICRLLVLRGANVSRRHKDGRTAARIARDAGHEEVAKHFEMWIKRFYADSPEAAEIPQSLEEIEKGLGWKPWVGPDNIGLHPDQLEGQAAATGGDEEDVPQNVVTGSLQVGLVELGKHDEVNHYEAFYCLADAVLELSPLCQELGVSTLDSFVFDEEAAYDELDDDDVDDEDALDDLREWHSREELLETVQALKTALAKPGAKTYGGIPADSLLVGLSTLEEQLGDCDGDEVQLTLND